MKMVAHARNYWSSKRDETECRLQNSNQLVRDSKFVDKEDIVALLEAVIKPYDKVVIEGDNQKQADFLARALCKVNPQKINNLHMIQSSISLPEHLDIFEKGIAKKLDFSYAGPQGKRLAEFVKKKKVIIGAIHTYLELYARYFVDLTPKIALIAADKADYNGNLYTGFNTEDTPVIVEAVKFKQGIVIVQVNEIVDKLPRIDIPSDWIDFIVKADKPYILEPLFTKKPSLITNKKILKAMMVIKGIYMEYGVKTLNHGIGFDTAAIELLLPTYGEMLGLKGKICTNFVLNPHPTLIPAIESGWVESVYCFGGEVGMDRYVSNRSDIFFIGRDGSLRSNRAFSQVAGHYATDLFIGSTLQIDIYGNSSTATKDRIVGYGGAPNLGCDARGRRHPSKAWLKCNNENTNSIGNITRGRKLVVQMIDAINKNGVSGFVRELDAVALAKEYKFDIEPVMIYGDDITHIVSEYGVAYLHKCSNIEERKAAICGISGNTELYSLVNKDSVIYLRKKGIIKTPEDLEIDVGNINKDLLAANTIKDIVAWSNHLYDPPKKYID